GVPAFFTAEGCATALAAMAGPWLQREDTEPRRHSIGSRRRTLNEVDALALFAEHGVPVARHLVAASPAQAADMAQALGARQVVVKIVSSHVAHKSDVGGVRTGVAPDDVAAVCEQLGARLDPGLLEAWLVQEQVAGGTEMLLGVIRDPQ